MSRFALIVLAGLAALAAAQNDPIHITIDTASGQQGDQIITDVGWHMDEEMYSWGADRRLLKDGEVHVLVLSDVYAGGAWDGRFFGNGPRLTTDFYYPSGRTLGGDFYFEIAGVEPVGGGVDAVFGWGENHNGVLMNSGESDGDTREGRSYYARNNYHMHHQIESLTELGLYDVTLVAWDGNGMYADADPFTLRYEVVPAPAGLLVLGALGLVRVRRRL
jgi:hypothetical protein